MVRHNNVERSAFRLRRDFPVFFISLLLLACPRMLLGQLPLARLYTLFPPGAKIGAQVELALTGADLDEANQLHFSDSGITAIPKTNAATGLPEPNKFMAHIAANVEPGVYEARVIGRFGISNPRCFVVGDLNETLGPATNNSIANAAAVSLGTTINGRSEANAEAFYKFSCRKGQRILVDCQAREIDSRMDAALVIYDAAGKELERNRTGALVDFTPSADGEFYVKVYDYLFRGGIEYFYRLTISTGPHLDFIFPPSGLAGAKAKHILYGRNLPGSTAAKDVAVQGKPLEQLEVEIDMPADSAPRRGFSNVQKAGDATLDAIEYRLHAPQGLSNPIRLSFATAPPVIEQEPNNNPAQAQRIVPPCELVGQFYPSRDEDWFTFDAKKGDTFWVEVFSERLGLPTSPFVLVQRLTRNDKGEEQASDAKEILASDANLGGVEYKTSTRDPAGRLEVAEDGSYRIQVRDLFNGSQSDPRLVYRLSIRKETPDFRLIAGPQPPPPSNKDSKEAVLWTPLLRRGETILIRVMAFRRDNFNGEIELAVENLPSGVTCNQAKIEKDKTSALLLLTAAENAASWSGELKIVGKARIAEKEVVRLAKGTALNWTVSDYENEAVQSRLSRDFVLAVSAVESAPISIEASENKTWEALEGAQFSIPVKVIRRADFSAALKLKAAGLAALDKLKEIELDGKATNGVVMIDLKELKLAPGACNFYLQTQTAGKYRNNPEAAKAAEEALKQAEKLVADLAAAVKTAPELKQAATKTAAESAAKARAASETLAQAARAATEAETLAKTAVEKLAAAKIALEEKAEDQALLATKEAAAKAVQETQAKATAALQAKSAAEKAAGEAQAKAKADADAQLAAEKAEAEAPAKLKEAEQKKEAAANRAKETAKTAEPRDVTITVYSAPINLKINPPPAAPAK